MFSFVVFILLLIAILLFFPISIRTVLSRTKRINLGKNLLAQKRAKIIKPKQSLLERHKADILRRIEAAHVQWIWTTYLKIAGGMSFTGLLFGAILDNSLLSGCMAVILPLLPSQYLKIKGIGYLRFLHMQIEDGLGLVTSAYMQSGDIRGAIDSTLPRLELPLKKVLADCANEIYLGAHTSDAIRRMKERVDDRYWREWCDILIQCQGDRTLKVLLPPLISQIADLRIIQAELDTTMANVWREHITISLLVAASVPLIRLLNVEWYALLTNTILGRIVVCMTYVAIFIATVVVLRVNKPVSLEV
jgi:hypothetical protein